MSYGNSLIQNMYYKSPLFVRNLLSSTYGLLQRKVRYGNIYKQYLRFLIDSQYLSN